MYVIYTQRSYYYQCHKDDINRQTASRCTVRLKPDGTR